MISKRRDDKGRVLQQGEWQEPSGRYRYKYTDSLGKRKILYSWRLTEADKMPEGKRADLSLRQKSGFFTERERMQSTVLTDAGNHWKQVDGD